MNDFYNENKKLFDEVSAKMKAEPKNPEHYLVLGRLYVMAEDYNNALKVYEDLLFFEPLAFPKMTISPS